MTPSFILVTELSACHPDWPAAAAQADALARSMAPQIGFTPVVRLASQRLASPSPPSFNNPAAGPHFDLPAVLADEAAANRRAIFLIPAILDFGVLRKAQLAEAAAEARHQFPDAVIAYDDVDPCHPLLVEAWTQRVYQRLAHSSWKPEQVGLLVTSRGDGGSAGRASSYRLMRLLWEQVGCARGDVAFCQHARPSLQEQLERLVRERLTPVIVPQAAWRDTHYEEVQAVCEYLERTGSLVSSCMVVDPIGTGFPAPGRRGAPTGLSPWLEQRMLKLWQERRDRSAGKEPSAHRGCSPQASRLRGPHASRALADLTGPLDSNLCYASGVIAEIYEEAGLAHLFKCLRIPSGTPSGKPRAEGSPASARVLVKVTWHGYAPGTYTDPVALDRLLGALPAPAVLLEGHTSSRNLGGAAWDWAKDSQRHRAWIAEQEAEYLRRTGLADVIRQHKAQYLNVTEAFWDGQCAPRERIEAILHEAGVQLHHPALAAYVPEALLALRGSPFISFARFKGPTRLSVANLFGLIPDVLRTSWHGPNLTHFARVCCDVAKLYGCLFRMYGMVEGLRAAVRWNRRGLYRSRWGNYDLIPHPGLVTFSQEPAVADVLASRLQGRQVNDSAFFKVLRQELGFPERAARLPIPEDLVLRLT